MNRSPRKLFVSSLALLMFSVIFQNCAPMKARQNREMKPVTVGLPIGAMFRPTGDMALGLNFASYSEREVKINQDLAEVRKDPEIERQGSQAATIFRFHSHYYPWADSAFFVGLGVDYYDSTISVAAQETEGGAFALTGAEAEQEYAVQTTQVRLPVGWSWIWNNGLSLLLDLGPVVSTNQDYESKKTEAASGEEAEQSQQTLESGILEFERGGVISPVFMVGYSF